MFLQWHMSNSQFFCQLTIITKKMLKKTYCKSIAEPQWLLRISLFYYFKWSGEQQNTVSPSQVNFWYCVGWGYCSSYPVKTKKICSLLYNTIITSQEIQDRELIRWNTRNLATTVLHCKMSRTDTGMSFTQWQLITVLHSKISLRHTIQCL